MSERGFIALARTLPSHPIVGFKGSYKPSEAWQWLLFEASWKPRRVGHGGVHDTIKLERGQLSHSLRFMADRWGWSVKRVRTFLAALESDTMIATQTGTGQTVITICNYGAYQCAPALEGTAKGTAKGTRGAQEGHKEGEQGNKVIKDNALSEASAEWYAVYPRKRARHDAIKAYRKLIASGSISHAALMERTNKFAAHWATQPKDRLQYCPYPASWLNSGQYADEIEAAPPTRKSGGEMKIEAATRDPRTFSEADWRSRLAIIARGERWPSQWGPKPGEPGCLVPAPLLLKQIPGERRATPGSSRI